MTPQELKNSILQLAIQGKLVEQRPEEGTAEELYCQLRSEKELGIKKGFWGKSKSLTEINENDILFEIPDSWRWIKIGEISSIVTKGTTPRGGNVSYTEKGIGFLRAENIAGLDKLDKTNLKYIDSTTHFGFLKRSIIQEDDILITIAGTLGRTAIVNKADLPLNANQAVSIVRLVNTQNVSLLYLIYALNSAAIQKYLTGQRKITAIPNLTLEIIENCLIPLPPLVEQKRIVSKIEELLPLIDRYEKAWIRLEDFNKRFPGDMQKSILQMAIQGKLVEQRPEEGTGEELYKQIQAEKQALIKAGRIKKEKPLPEVTEEEIPFEIPDSWKWVRLSVVVDVRDGTHNTPLYLSSGYPLITGKDFYSGKFDLSKTQFISETDYIEIKQRSNVEIGDILFSMIGGNIGSMIKITEDNYFEMAIKNVALFKQYNYNQPLTDFLFIFLRSQVQKLKAIAKGGAQSFVPLNTLRSYCFPLPPYKEQKRIVAKLEELLPLCERLNT